MNIVKTQLEEILKKAIQSLYGIELDVIQMDTPPKKELGEFCFGPFVLSKQLAKSPAIIAQELKNQLENSLLEDLNIAGPYLNFRVSKAFYSQLFLQESFFIPQVGNGKNIIVDYIGANVGKPMHIGHMCTPNQGQITVNLFRVLGYNVISDSHIGDWGIIFGKLITAYKMWGDDQKLHQNAVEHLLELYIKITAEAEKNPELDDTFRVEFKKLSQGEDASVAYWTQFTKYSIEALQTQLSRLGVEPNYNIGESFYEGIGLPKMENYPDLISNMSDIVEELIQKGVAIRNDDNSVGVTFSDETKLPSCMLQKRDGTHGYLASDLAAVKYRMQNWNPEKIIYHVDVRQQLHLKQVFEISKLAGWIDENTQLFHAYNGFITLKDGAMSTRHGNIIKLDALLDEAKARAKAIILEKRNDFEEEELEKISEIIGVGAIKYGYLSKSRTSDMVFDWDEFMTFEGNSFPYVAYAYVRSMSLLEKSGYIRSDMKNQTISAHFTTQEEVDLYKEISEFSEVLLQVSKTLLPHNLVGYVYSLTKKFSALYNNLSILNETDEQKKILVLKLIVSFQETLEKSFEILAIKLPTKM